MLHALTIPRLTRALLALFLSSASLLHASQALAASPSKPKASTVAADEVELRFYPLPRQHQQFHSVTSSRTVVRMEPSEGMSEEERAKMEQAAQASLMPMTVRTEVDYGIWTSAPDKQGNFLLQLRGKVKVMDMRNAAGERIGMPAQPLDLKIDAKLNQNTGAVQPIAPTGPNELAAGVSETLFQQLLIQMEGLEGQRLRVGESAAMPLDVALPIPKRPDMNMKTMSRYTLVKLHEGIADFDLSVDIGLAPEASPTHAEHTGAAEPDAASNQSPSDALRRPPMPAVTVSGQGQGHMRLRLADRLILRQKMEMTMSMRAHAPGKPIMNMRFDMQTESTGKSLKR